MKDKKLIEEKSTKWDYFWDGILIGVGVGFIFDTLLYLLLIK